MPIRELRVKVRAVVEPDGDMFHAYAPDLKGVHVCGETAEEAACALHDAIRLYLASLAKHSEPVPLGLAETDRVHSNRLSMMWTFLKEKFGRSRHKSYVDEIVFNSVGERQDRAPA